MKQIHLYLHAIISLLHVPICLHFTLSDHHLYLSDGETTSVKLHHHIEYQIFTQLTYSFLLCFSKYLVCTIKNTCTAFCHTSYQHTKKSSHQTNVLEEVSPYIVDVLDIQTKTLAIIQPSKRGLVRHETMHGYS